MLQTLSTAALCLATVANAYDHGSTYGGSGPYKSYYFEDATLANHTFYMPLQSAFGKDPLKLPVIVWGRYGACDPWGLKFRNFLGEVSSHGALIIATGAAFVDPDAWAALPPVPQGEGQNPGALTEAIDWVYANAGKGVYKHVDKSRIGVWGQSCGGLEALSAGSQDTRVSHLGIFNSGELDEGNRTAIISKIEKPIFYFIGGPTDIAYKNANADWIALPATTPRWKGNHAKGHSAAFDDPDAGIVGIAGKNLLNWLLRGDDKDAKRWFTNNGWSKTGFTGAEFDDLDKINIKKI